MLGADDVVEPVLPCRLPHRAVSGEPRCFNREAYGGWDRSGEREVDIVSGCYLLIETSLWRTLGGFDPSFFMYGEEADLCLRARAHGARPMATGGSTIVHLGGDRRRSRSGKVVQPVACQSDADRPAFSAAATHLARILLAPWPASRALVNGALATVRGGKRRQHEAAVWREVWARRREWIGGYGARPSPSPRLRGEGRGEGQRRRTICPRSGGSSVSGCRPSPSALSPQAGRGDLAEPREPLIAPANVEIGHG